MKPKFRTTHDFLTLSMCLRPLKCPWKEMFKRLPICRIKAETPLETISPPVPNFRSSTGAMLYLINRVSCGSSHPIVGRVQEWNPLSPHGKSAAAQTQQSKESRRHIEPIEADSWCNAAAMYPQTHIAQKPPPQRKCRAAIPAASRYEGRFLVVLIRVNGWGRKGIDTVISYVCCPVERGI